MVTTNTPILILDSEHSERSIDFIIMLNFYSENPFNDHKNVPIFMNGKSKYRFSVLDGILDKVFFFNF